LTLQCMSTFNAQKKKNKKQKKKTKSSRKLDIVHPLSISFIDAKKRRLFFVLRECLVSN